MKGNSVQSKAFGDDGGYNIDIPDLANVLKKSFSEKLDFVLFDACMMGNAVIFAATCAWQKFLDPAALGGDASDLCHWCGGL